MTVRELIQNLLKFDLDTEIDTPPKRGRMPVYRREIITRTGEDYKSLQKDVYEEIQNRESNGWHLEYLSRRGEDKPLRVCFEYIMYKIE